MLLWLHPTLPEILAVHTRCRKGLMAYHKFNGITMMKKHVEFNHFTLLKMFLKNVAIEIPTWSWTHVKKKENVSPSNIFGFFY
jgi:hypothetical protein